MSTTYRNDQPYPDNFTNDIHIVGGVDNRNRTAISSASGNVVRQGMGAAGQAFVDPATQQGVFTANSVAGTSLPASGGAFLDVMGSTVTRARLIVINNATDRDVTYSLDGTNSHGFVKQGTELKLELSANGVFHTGRVYVKSTSTAGTTGTFYATMFS